MKYVDNNAWFSSLTFCLSDWFYLGEKHVDNVFLTTFTLMKSMCTQDIDIRLSVFENFYISGKHVDNVHPSARLWQPLPFCKACRQCIVIRLPVFENFYLSGKHVDNV